MSISNRDKPFKQVVARIYPDSRLLQTWVLAGGVSAQMTGLDIALVDGKKTKLILRQHGEIDRQQNPHIAVDEFRLLQILQSKGLPVPAPVFLDASGEIFPHPYSVLEYVEGKPDLTPGHLPDFIFQFASLLSRIHQIDRTKEDLVFLLDAGKGFGERPVILDHSLSEGIIRDVLESIHPFPELNKPVLLHGDFWPGNILWNEGEVAAIIDWEDAKIGDPLADVANSRLELLWAFGVEAMATFTHTYKSLTKYHFAHLPYWDLCAALRPATKLSTWGLDVMTEKRMRERHKWFVNQALEKLEESTF